MWVGAAAAESFNRGKGSCAHFPPDSLLLLLQMLFVRQHRGNPHGAADQGFSPPLGRHKLFSRAASGLAVPPRGGKGLHHSTGKNKETGRRRKPWPLPSKVSSLMKSAKKYWESGVNFLSSVVIWGL